MSTQAAKVARFDRPAYRPGASRLPPPSVLARRVEGIYIACVSFALGAVGTAIGFTFGVVPYFRSAAFGRYDWFFASCVGAGAVAGFIVGVANGARWFRASEASPLTQKRMLAYLRRRGLDVRGVPQRTLNSTTMRSLLGSRRTPRA